MVLLAQSVVDIFAWFLPSFGVVVVVSWLLSLFRS